MIVLTTVGEQLYQVALDIIGTLFEQTAHNSQRLINGAKCFLVPTKHYQDSAEVADRILKTASYFALTLVQELAADRN